MLFRALGEAVVALELPGRALLVAVSGGVDSVALPTGLYELCSAIRPQAERGTRESRPARGGIRGRRGPRGRAGGRARAWPSPPARRSGAAARGLLEPRAPDAAGGRAHAAVRGPRGRPRGPRSRAHRHRPQRRRPGRNGAAAPPARHRPGRPRGHSGALARRPVVRPLLRVPRAEIEAFRARAGTPLARGRLEPAPITAATVSGTTGSRGSRGIQPAPAQGCRRSGRSAAQGLGMDRGAGRARSARASLSRGNGYASMRGLVRSFPTRWRGGWCARRWGAAAPGASCPACTWSEWARSSGRAAAGTSSCPAASCSRSGPRLPAGPAGGQQPAGRVLGFGLALTFRIGSGA